jgi:hypothetical protein
MKLDRNINPDGRGKYALVLLRNVNAMPEGEQKNEVLRCLDILSEHDVVDLGDENTDGEFFVLRLRDVGAPIALGAYASCFRQTDPEWAAEVSRLAEKAYAHPNKKQPD